MSVMNDDNLFSVAGDCILSGYRVALAVVTKTWGSSPRQVGSMMLVREDRIIYGSVSGGCVEGAVIEASLELINHGGIKKLDFGVSDPEAWEVGLSCGGEISVWLITFSDGFFEKSLLFESINAVKKREKLVLKFNLETGQVQKTKPDLEASCLTGHEFVLVKSPQPNLIIIGAVHISQHLAQMAMQCDFDVTIIDPREIFANQARFPSVKLINAWPDEVLKNMVLDINTSLVTLTHDPKIDDPALVLSLSWPLFYFACLGSKKTHEARTLRLLNAGVSQSNLNRIRGPAGLDIGAKTSAEIAVSILAELVSAYHARHLIKNA